MKHIHILTLLLSVSIGAAYTQHPSVIPPQNIPPSDAESKKVCVIGNVVKSSVVLFKDRLTLTQAIKEAGGISPNSKNNRLRITRHLEGSEMEAIDVDLKAIEKGRVEDLVLRDKDIVEVTAKDKKKRVPINEADCAPCGCKLYPSL
jgi:protein involved in polysaccharide export with SLBB domain